MPSRRGTITFGALRITYRLWRSERRKTINIAVDPREGVVVTAPQDMAVGHVHQIVARKAGWIAGKLRDLRDINGDARDREFVSGESFPYLGRNYRLKVISRARPGTSLRFFRGRLEMTVDQRLSPTARRTTIRTALCRWYRDRAAQRVPERVTIWAPRLGVTPASILICDQRRRWGSCNRKGHIRVNWRIIMAPMSLVDYVAAHELCHLIRLDHSPAFWKLLRTIMPNYAEHRERLRREGARFWL